MLSKISVRWQTVIPREIREAMGIEPEGSLDWEIKDGVIHVYPIPADPVAAVMGMFRDDSFSWNDELLEDRRRDREHDEEQERRWGIPPAPGRK